VASTTSSSIYVVVDVEVDEQVVSVDPYVVTVTDVPLSEHENIAYGNAPKGEVIPVTTHLSSGYAHV
jgi:hypothetical protein